MVFIDDMTVTSTVAEEPEYRRARRLLVARRGQELRVDARAPTWGAVRDEPGSLSQGIVPFCRRRHRARSRCSVAARCRSDAWCWRHASLACAPSPRQTTRVVARSIAISKVVETDRTHCYATALRGTSDFLEGRLAYEALQATGRPPTMTYAQAASRSLPRLAIGIVDPQRSRRLSPRRSHGLPAKGPRPHDQGRARPYRGCVEQALQYARSVRSSRTTPSARRALAEALQEAPCALPHRARRGADGRRDQQTCVRVADEVTRHLDHRPARECGEIRREHAAPRCGRRSRTSDARTVLEVMTDDGWAPAGDVPVFERPPPARTAAGSSTGMGLHRGRAARRWASPWRWPEGRVRACSPHDRRKLDLLS